MGDRSRDHAAPRREGHGPSVVPFGVAIISLGILGYELIAFHAHEHRAEKLWVAAVAFVFAVVQGVSLTLSATRRPRETQDAPLGGALSGGVLVAVSYPEQSDRIERLLSVTDVSRENLLVLFVCHSRSPRIHSVSAGGIMRRRDTPLYRALARRVDESRRPVALLRARGPDPAAVVLYFAAIMRVGRVVALRSEGVGLEEERERAMGAWGELTVPRRSLRVQLIGSDAASSVSFDLPSQAATQEHIAGV